jgi:hypothetical protein
MAEKYYNCVGGPEDGHYLTEKEAGNCYFQFNSACGEIYPSIIVESKKGSYSISPTYKNFKKYKINVDPLIPSSILVYFSRCENVVVKV